MADPSAIAEEQAALRRVATLVAAGAEPADVFPPSPRRPAGCSRARSAARSATSGDVALTVGRWSATAAGAPAVRGRHARAARRQRRARPRSSRAPGARRAIDDYDGVPRPRGGADARARLPRRGRRADRRSAGGLWGAACSSRRPAPARSAPTPSDRLGGLRRARRARRSRAPRRASSSTPRGCGSSRRATRSAAASSATSTTAPSSGSWRSRSSSAMLERKLASDPEAALTARSPGARAELDRRCAELRELARGLHPAVLTDRGLARRARRRSRTRAPLPVEVIGAPDERLAEAVEAARVLRRRRERSRTP